MITLGNYVSQLNPLGLLIFKNSLVFVVIFFYCLKMQPSNTGHIRKFNKEKIKRDGIDKFLAKLSEFPVYLTTYEFLYFKLYL